MLQKQGSKETTREARIDHELLRQFDEIVMKRVPHIDGGRVANKTPLVDISGDAKEIASSIYGLNISASIFGKEEWLLPTASIKMRAASNILYNAIKEGKLRSGMPIFEATSGNFGISLGYMSELGLHPFAVVSRKIYDGVSKALKKSGVGVIFINTEICPAPGATNTHSQAELIAQDVANQLKFNGLDAALAEKRMGEMVKIIEQNNPMKLAAFLASAYGGFCPTQYENDNNVGAYLVMGKELDEQFAALGRSLKEYSIVCTFGTGGTSAGLSRYYTSNFNRKGVFVVFPKNGQDVAGIRTKTMAGMLKFYKPDLYAGELELDWTEASKVQAQMIAKGYDIGESSALALYGAMMLAARGIDKLVVIMPDDSSKYVRSEVSISIDEAKAGPYENIVWVNDSYVPNEKGIEVVEKIFAGKKLVVPESESAASAYQGDKTVFFCIAGVTSARFVKSGNRGKSLSGGLEAIAKLEGFDFTDLIEERSDRQ